MPNHVKNRVSFSGKDVYSILEKVNNEGEFDFERIIPMPETISRGNISFEEMKASKGNNWYDWSIANWGTKWNAYDCEFGGNGVEFSTAWSMPEPIFVKLSEMFPEIEITVEYADEDTGNNVGIMVLLNGGIVSWDELSGTKAGYDLALEISYGMSFDDYINEYYSGYEEDSKSLREYYESLG